METFDPKYNEDKIKELEILLSNEVISLKDNLNNKGEIIIFFTERSKINLKDILRIIKIILFGKGEFQFWGYERNSKFYVSIFKNAGYELHEALDINNHRCLIFKFNKI